MVGAAVVVVVVGAAVVVSGGAVVVVGAAVVDSDDSGLADVVVSAESEHAARTITNATRMMAVGYFFMAATLPSLRPCGATRSTT